MGDFTQDGKFVLFVCFVVKKDWEAKFRNCFSQVQQVKLVNKMLENAHVVFINTHSKLQKV